MYLAGLGFSLIVMLCQVIDVFLMKKIMINVDAKENSLYRIMFVTPVLVIAALFNRHITEDVWGWLLFYSVAEAVNILTYCMALNISETTFIYIVSKMDLIFIMLVGKLTGLETVNIVQFISIILFMIGIFLLMEIKINKNNFIVDKQIMKGIGLMTLSAIGRTIKPYTLKHIMINNYASNETSLVISMLISFILIYILIRPKLYLDKERIKSYSMQAIIMGITMICLGYSALYAGVLTSAVITASSIILIAIISVIFFKVKFSIQKIVGIIFAFIGLINLT